MKRSGIKYLFVTKVDLQQELDVDYIARHGCNTYMKYNASTVVMRSKRLNATAVYFRSGKMVCSGGTSRTEARRIARSFARKAQKLGNPFIEFTKFTVVNIVATIDLKRVLNLEKMAVVNPSISYEPELQPFAVFNSEDKTCLIFSTGKIIVHRGLKVSDVKRSLRKLVSDVCINQDLKTQQTN